MGLGFGTLRVLQIMYKLKKSFQIQIWNTMQHNEFVFELWLISNIAILSVFCWKNLYPNNCLTRHRKPNIMGFRVSFQTRHRKPLHYGAPGKFSNTSQKTPPLWGSAQVLKVVFFCSFNQSHAGIKNMLTTAKNKSSYDWHIYGMLAIYTECNIYGMLVDSSYWI